MFPGKYLALIPLSTVIALAEASTIHSMTQLSVKYFNRIMHSQQKFSTVIWRK